MKLRFAMKYVVFFFLCAAMSCEETLVEYTFIPGTTSDFRIGQTYSSSDGQYHLLIKEIGDSRCPRGVQCVWQGEVTLKGEWTENSTKSNVELHSVLKDQQTEPDGYDIQIVHAEPYPIYGSGSKPEDLVITLLIQKK